MALGASGVNLSHSTVVPFEILADGWEIDAPQTVTIPECQFNAMQHQIAFRVYDSDFVHRQSQINEDLARRLEILEKDKKDLQEKNVSLEKNNAKSEAEGKILKTVAVFGSGCLLYGQSGAIGAGILIYDIIQSANVILCGTNIYNNVILWKNAKA